MEISVTFSRFAILLASVLTDIKLPREFVSRLQILEKKSISHLLSEQSINWTFTEAQDH